MEDRTHETPTGKKPASKIPKITLKPAKVFQSLANPIPIITHPQKNVSPPRNTLGPIFRVSTVAGGWKTIYVVKNTNVIIDYPPTSATTIEHI